MTLRKADLPKAFKVVPSIPKGSRKLGPGYGFPKGHKFSTKENTPAESYSRKMSAMYRGWETRVRKASGEKIVSIEQKRKKEERVRVKLRETIVTEAREIQEMARMAANRAMRVLESIIDNEDSRTSDKLTAINILLDRAYGKAAQTNVNTNIDANSKEADVSATELDRRIKAALNRVEAITGGAGEAPASEERPVDLCEYDRDPNSSTKH